jgi:hypothetical protein
MTVIKARIRAREKAKERTENRDSIRCGEIIKVGIPNLYFHCIAETAGFR